MSIIARLASTEAGSFFFQPLQFHLEAPDLLVEFHLSFLVLALLRGPIAAENCASHLQQLAFPLADLSGMHAMLAGKLVDRLQALRSFQGQLELELGSVASPFLGHRFDPPLAGLVTVFFHLHQWSSFWGQLYSFHIKQMTNSLENSVELLLLLTNF